MGSRDGRLLLGIHLLPSQLVNFRRSVRFMASGRSGLRGWEEGFIALTRRFLRQLQTIRESGDDLEQRRI